MTDLISRVRSATEGSRELDLAIMIAIDQPDYAEHFERRLSELKAEVERNGLTAHRPEQMLRDDVNASPRYTSSLDAAIALCARVLGEGWRRLITNHGYVGGYHQGPMVELYAPWSSGPVTARGVAATEPLALVLSILMAKGRTLPGVADAHGDQERQDDGA